MGEKCRKLHCWLQDSLAIENYLLMQQIETEDP
jgi:hypothetical protein